ncbi:hypothetical protein COO00_19785 [Bacillus toyonensis]|nr:hypothetical protein CON93_06255 [Bacillus toyonensis]PEA70878.1 hypothetical protein COO00_19785 [Bacillus toyonensis]
MLVAKLNDLIENKKLQLVELVKKHGFSHTKVLHLSQEIDKLINKYMIIKKEPYNSRVQREQIHKINKENNLIMLELRGIVSTNRYSIPGLPCIYLGSSPLTCWEELNKPDLNMVQTSVFKSDDISYIDLSTPPVVFIEKIIKKFDDFGTIMKERLFADRLNEPNEVISYLIIWPLMAACSVRVKNTTDTFKPEYIIPQLLLQFIRYNGFFDGVSYFSTKVDN